MVQLPFAVASLALMSLVASNPTPQAFSFAQWARQISADPKGKHLSPEEAVAAFKNNTHPPVVAKDDGYGCGNAPDHPAYGPDAVYCTNYLAGLGDQRCEVHGVVSTFCSWYGAEAVAVIDGNYNYDTTPCRHAAEILGGIMDRCYDNANDRVQGYGQPTNIMQLNLGSPQ